MKFSRALLLGLVLGATVGAAGCSGIGNDYEPGISNPGYTPGHGRTSYAAAFVSAPDRPSPDRASPANANGAPASAGGLASGTG